MGRAFITSGAYFDRVPLDVPDTWVRGVTFRRGSGTGAQTSRFNGTPIFVLPREYGRVMRVIVSCRATRTGHSRGLPHRGYGILLRNMNRRRQDKLEASLAFFGALRSMSVLAYYYSSVGCRRASGAPRGIAIDANRQTVQLGQDARALQQQLDRHRSLIADPLPVTHGAYMARVRHVADGLLSELTNSENKQVFVRFMDDRTIDPQVKHAYMRVYFASVSEVAQQIAQTVRFDDGPRTTARYGIGGLAHDSIVRSDAVANWLRQHHPNLTNRDARTRNAELGRVSLHNALNQARGDANGGVLEAALSAAGIYGNVYGNVGYGDALTMGLAKVGIARIIGSQRLRRVLGPNMLRMYERFICRDLPTARGRELVRAAFNSPTDANVRAATREVNSRFQSGWRRNAAITALAVVQFAFVVYSAGQDGRIDGGEALNLLESGVGAGTSVVSFLAGGGIRVRSITQAFSQLDDVLSRYETTCNRFFAVVAICKGLWDLNRAIEEDNPREQVIAGLTVLSGLALAAGAWFGVPGGQPVGVALGIIAAAVGLLGWAYDQTLPELGRELRLLRRYLDSARDGRRFMDSPRLPDEIKQTWARIKTGLNDQAYKFAFYSGDQQFGPCIRDLRAVGYRYRLAGSSSSGDTLSIDDLIMRLGPRLR